LDPDFIYPGSRISNPTTTTKEEGGKFNRIENYIFEQLKKNVS
jgi:hypothetical protein